MNMFEILKNLYTNPSSKWIHDLNDSQISPVVIQRYISLNRSVCKRAAFLNQFVYSLSPKTYLSAVWAVLFKEGKKYSKAPFIKYPTKNKDKVKFEKLIGKMRRHYKLADNDINSNLKFLIPFIEKNKIEMYSFYGMSAQDWIEENLCFDSIKKYGNRPKVEVKKGLDAWF